MTAILVAGFLLYVVPLLVWHASQVMRGYFGGRAVPPRVYLLQRVLILGGSVVWFALIALSAGVSLLSLAFGFALVLVPVYAMALVSGYRADLRRYKSLSGAASPQERQRHISVNYSPEFNEVQIVANQAGLALLRDLICDLLRRGGPGHAHLDGITERPAGGNVSSLIIEKK